MDEYENVFTELKGIDWSQALVTLYVVHRKMSRRIAKYSVFKINTEDSIQTKIKEITNRIISRSNSIEAYDYLTSDQDQNLLSISTNKTDFYSIEKIIHTSHDIDTIEHTDQLLKAKMYVACLEFPDNQIVYAVKMISDSWNTKKVGKITDGISSFFSVVMQGNTLIDLEHQQIFELRTTSIFFSFKEKLFILNKDRFEKATNFREGMVKNRDIIIRDFARYRIVDDVDGFKNAIGDNITLLRKLSQVKNAKYYKNPEFLSKLHTVSSENNWGIEFSGTGEIVFDDNALEILTILNNDRLLSQLTDETFDVNVKKEAILKHMLIRYSDMYFRKFLKIKGIIHGKNTK